jgi:hypothetical protein
VSASWSVDDDVTPPNVEGRRTCNKARESCYGSECHTFTYSPMPARAADDDLRIDTYVVDVLMQDLIGHDRAPSAFVVYLFLWRNSLGRGERDVRTSLREIAEGTGLSKRGVQEALTVLSRRKLVGIARQSITDVPLYTVNRPWRR